MQSLFPSVTTELLIISRPLLKHNSMDLKRSVLEGINSVSTQSLSSLSSLSGLPFHDHLLSMTLQKTTMSWETSTVKIESFSPVLPLISMQYQDHVLSITLSSQRALLQETYTVTMQFLSPLSPLSDWPFKTIFWV